ncbi:MAG TPA: hypothetical protein ENN17_10075 [bacterium]|nr:hypothetical protein [bacterium]
MENKAEILNRNRRKMLFGIVMGFGFWHGSQTLKSFFPEQFTTPGISLFHLVVIILGLTGWIYFVFYCCRMVKMIAVLKKNIRLNQTLNDEFYQQIRMRSFYYAFMGVLITQALLLLFSFFFSVSARSVINLNILVCVITPIVSFILLDQDK